MVTPPKSPADTKNKPIVMIQTSMQRPTANITVNRNRTKTYGSKIYLKSGTHYEIELFNPTKLKVLATIEIDGKSISSAGIILLPGQRVFLERWINEPRKFLFSTYEAEDSLEGKAATAENGKVKVLFYDEIVKNYFPAGTGDIYWYYNTNSPFFGINIGETYTTCSNSPSTFTNAVNYSSSIDFSASETKSFETGISEKGEKSSQKFAESSGDFSFLPSSYKEWQILPDSQEPVEAVKIRSYCPECGTRVRASSWKFCTNCGTKL